MARRWSCRRVTLTLIPIWLISVLIYVPHMLVLSLDEYDCFDRWPATIYKRIYSLFILFSMYIIPLLITGICYAGSAAILKRATRSMSRFGGNDFVVQRRKDDRRMVTILVAIVAGFAILTLPNAILFLYVDFSTTVDHTTQDIIHAFAVILFLHTFFNPVCYSILDKKFRRDMQFLCVCTCGRCRENVQMRQQRWQNQETFSTSTIVLHSFRRNFDEQTTESQETGSKKAAADENLSRL